MLAAFTRIFVLAGVAGVLALGSAARAAALPANCVAPPATYKIRTDRTGSYVNWCDGQLEVVGQGFALGKGDAVRFQARSTAFTILINEARKAIGSLRIDAATTLSVALDDEANRRVAEDMIARMRIVHEQWDDTRNAYTIIGTLPIYGEFGLSLLGARGMASFKPVDLTADMVTITAPIPRGHTPQPAGEPYTGIIVNGDAALLTPCLLPRIMRFDGKELWGPFTLTAAEVITGPVRYAPNYAAALKEKLAGDCPLVISAVGNGLGVNPVINLDDVYLVLTQQKKARIFNRMPIIITLGQKEPADAQ